MKNPLVNQVPYKQVPDPENSDQWLLEIGETVVRIKTVHLEINEEADELRFNYTYDTVSGRPINEEILTKIVNQLIVEQAEYQQGRDEYLAEKE